MALQGWPSIVYANITDPEIPSVAPQQSCHVSTFQAPVIPGVSILSMSAEERHEFTLHPPRSAAAATTSINFCDVKIHLTHPGTNDDVLVEVWLPLEDWNGRFQATGGGGYATGIFDLALGPAITTGYAAASTDGGHDEGFASIEWALNEDHSINWNLLHNFAAKSLADMILVGKSITEQFYGEAPHHSYWNGCSQGGRQGFAIAQKYPDLLDGIAAHAPALSIVSLFVAEFWPQLVMKESDTFLSNCELQVFESKELDECDTLDGAVDGVIEDPSVCKFDPAILVGQKTRCDEGKVEVTKGMANVFRKIREGPKTPFGEQVWHGLTYGTPTQFLANITTTPDGARIQNPFQISSFGFRNLLLKDRSFDLSILTYSDYMALWTQASHQYGWLLDANVPNLDAFRDTGGKLLSWHGMSDPLIPYQNSVRYRESVQMEMGGAGSVNEFYRLFLAPGVGHCNSGVGPVPKDALQQLVDWVEKGEVPERLDAETLDKEGELVTKELCAFPTKSKFMGVGDPKRASSWSCEGEENEEETHDKDTADFLGGLKDKLTQAALGMGLRIG
ncbi:feruloyl esterase B precursor [Lophiostoma macrostomum CBS 122681]|uniref:Carboxylic ester hydrolase n=1 Tax=Lophiostoma macrostomum CBS 122681 TaxID=1314788 RepID=A0A6A6TFH7_9PLEO|nr:feruloyl esterase B precursor [Lophiostoma macrostomum CBS 122681]